MPKAVYRPEIDGLRALAVFLVIFYHFDIDPFRAGFIGVDVFFVISGYLITSIIRQETAQNHFSIRQFYARRIRRIVPALALVIAASLAAGWLLLLPSDLAALGQQAGYAAVGLSNFYFEQSTGYFDRAAELQPLLHTWSLGVEEQFYLVWPFLLWAAYKLSFRWSAAEKALLAVVILASFGWSAYAAAYEPKAAFFMLPSRAWELALGGFITYLPKVPQRFGRLAELAGVALIVASAVLLTKDTLFPGAAALPVCLGAVLLVAPKQQLHEVSRVLASQSCAFFGRMSYSLYLWHWPILVFFKIYANGQSPRPLETILLLSVTVIVSFCSWMWIETPFRRARHGSVPPLTLVASGALCAVGLAVAFKGGLPGRLPAQAIRLDEVRMREKGGKAKVINCHGPVARGDQKQISACIERREGVPNVLVLGDSHAGHFRAALVEKFPGVRFVAVVTSGCRPVVNFVAVDERERRCNEIFQRVFSEIIPKGVFDAVIISARWKNGQYEKISDTVRQLERQGQNVIVFGQTLEYAFDLPDILASQYLPRRKITSETNALFSEAKAIDVEMRHSLEGSKAQYYSVIDVVCPAGSESCQKNASDGELFTYDYGHLTISGARDVLTAFKAAGLAMPPPTSEVDASRVLDTPASSPGAIGLSR